MVRCKKLSIIFLVSYPMFIVYSHKRPKKVKKTNLTVPLEAKAIKFRAFVILVIDSVVGNFERPLVYSNRFQ